MTAPAKRIYIIAGEDSGDALGAALIEALRQHAPEPLDLARAELAAVALQCPELVVEEF